MENRTECVLDLHHISIWLLNQHPIFKDGYYWKEGRYGSGPYTTVYEALRSFEAEVKKRKEAAIKKPAPPTAVPLALVPEPPPPILIPLNVINVDFNAKCKINEKT